MSAISRSKRIAELNDQLRARAGLPYVNGRGAPKALVVVTRGVLELAPVVQLSILEAVRSFSDFTEDNDPYGEHDFGALGIVSAGKIFWKIDYYADSSCREGSDDPSDPERTFRVLTIMLAGEY